MSQRARRLVPRRSVNPRSLLNFGLNQNTSGFDLALLDSDFLRETERYAVFKIGKNYPNFIIAH